MKNYQNYNRSKGSKGGKGGSKGGGRPPRGRPPNPYPVYKPKGTRRIGAPKPRKILSQHISDFSLAREILQINGQDARAFSWKIKGKKGVTHNSPSARDTETAKIARIKSFQWGENAQNKIGKLLVEKLAYCTPERRCKSRACPVCATDSQRLFVGMVNRLLKQNPLPDYRVTLIPNYSFKEGELTNRVFEPLQRRLGAILRKAGIRMAICGHDISLNLHEEGAFETHWQPHTAVYFNSIDIVRVKAVFNKYFPATSSIPKPVHIQALDKNLAGYAYGLKPNFTRRITESSTSVERQNTNGQSLTIPQTIEVLSALDGIGFEGRMFLHGCGLKVENGGYHLCTSPMWRLEKPPLWLKP